MNIEDLRLHADIISADGHKLGALSRFVFELASRKLTHIVIDTGILRSGQPFWKGGWGLSHDRFVPIGVLESADSRAIRLTMTADEFRDLSHDYVEEYFKPLPDLEPGEPDLSDIARLAMSIPGEPGPYLMQQATALPPHEAEVHDESPVAAEPAPEDRRGRARTLRGRHEADPRAVIRRATCSRRKSCRSTTSSRWSAASCGCR
jgi:hypothetical protein